MSDDSDEANIKLIDFNHSAMLGPGEKGTEFLGNIVNYYLHSPLIALFEPWAD